LQAAMKKPLYFDNLNWFGDVNQSFLYSEQNGKKIIHKHLVDHTCEYWEANIQSKMKDGSSIYCEPTTKTYYCHS